MGITRPSKTNPMSRIPTLQIVSCALKFGNAGFQVEAGVGQWSPTAKAVLAHRSMLQHAGVVSCVGE